MRTIIKKLRQKCFDDYLWSLLTNFKNWFHFADYGKYGDKCLYICGFVFCYSNYAKTLSVHRRPHPWERFGVPQEKYFFKRIF